jgi:hypothetical protein
MSALAPSKQGGKHDIDRKEGLGLFAETTHGPGSSDHLGYKLPPYGALRLLQRLDLVDKHGPHPNAKSTFVASGRPLKLDPVYMRQTL